MRKLLTGLLIASSLIGSAAVWAMSNLNQPAVMNSKYFNQTIRQPIPPTSIFSPDSSSLRPNPNPGPITQAADLFLTRPALFVSTALGTGTYVLTLPFTYLNDSSDDAQQRLITEPFQAATSSCLGCAGTMNLEQ
jgi:hypothetical protein